MRKFISIFSYLLGLATEIAASVAGAAAIFGWLDIKYTALLLCPLLLAIYLFNLLYDKISRIDGESIFHYYTVKSLRGISVGISILMIAVWVLIVLRYALLFFFEIDVIYKLKEWLIW